MKTAKITLLVIGSLYAAMFFFTGAFKWATISYFLKQMVRNPFPDSWAPWIAYGLPSLMLLLAIFFVLTMLQLIKDISLYLFSISTLIMITLAVYSHLVLIGYFPGIRPCSCSGILDMSWEQHVIFNSVYSLLGILAITLTLALPYWDRIRDFYRIFVRSKIQVKFAAWYRKEQAPPNN
ncbi:hypothetical protein SAMN05216436_105119 [bacterium A37T11]|nr:hypothetical protein SAMN05216436_105119 [bacterium A37T11]